MTWQSRQISKNRAIPTATCGSMFFCRKLGILKQHTATAYSLFVEAFNKAKLRKRLMAGGVSSDQTDAWIDDKKYPVLASDYVNWTTLPAEYLYKGLNDALQEIADQVLPEVGPNITEWTRIKKSE